MQHVGYLLKCGRGCVVNYLHLVLCGLCRVKKGSIHLACVLHF